MSFEITSTGSTPQHLQHPAAAVVVLINPLAFYHTPPLLTALPGLPSQVELATGAACILGVSAIVMGVLVLAVGTSVPDMIGSMIAAKNGEASVRVASIAPVAHYFFSHGTCFVL